jgi:hypothetical protein
LGGASGRTYDVTLHLRGVIEQKTYSSGCADGMWLIGGTPDSGTFNVYRLSVSSPAQTFYLNAGQSSINHLWTLDITRTIRMDAGATITLFADSIEGSEIKNIDESGIPISITGVSPTQPFNGQFIQMDVESVVLDPYTSCPLPAGMTGSALSFASSQRVTVADSASLHPQALTIEGWFLQAGTSGSYNTIMGKGYNATDWDSYSVWYSPGALQAELVTTSANVAQLSVLSVPWIPDIGTWHHVAYTFDNANARHTLFIDGLPVACAGVAGTLTVDSTPLLLGGDIESGSPYGFWDGQLDEIRLFSIARSPDQIWVDMHQHTLGAVTGLVAEWRFDEGSGQVCSNSAVSGDCDGVLGSTNATESSDPTWVTPSTAP